MLAPPKEKGLCLWGGGYWTPMHSDNVLLEAWERMTHGGVNGKSVRPTTPFVRTVFASGHVHTEYLAYAAR